MDKIKKMEHWCRRERIMETPTIFINGYELPNEYTVEDLNEILIWALNKFHINYSVIIKVL